MTSPISPEVERLVAGQKTVAGKIRTLAAAGYPRAEIARMLGKRYQHVRNVLEEPKAATINVHQAPPGLAEADTKPFQHAIPHTYWLDVGANGSVVLPPEVLEALGARPGGLVIADLGEESFTLVSGITGIRLMKARLAQPPSFDKLASEELIEDRRREAAIDELEAQMHEARMRRGG
jgi:bifunctional DNA-binding transcriptional regulator/antitoxin component of YhaV-PrlF toxin-antitoxin module